MDEPQPKNVGGRPSKKSPELTAKICEAISCGLSNAQAAKLVRINVDTLYEWFKDPEFDEEVQSAVMARLLGRIQSIEAGGKSWQSIAWIVERMYPDQFARPEVQVLLKGTVVNNNLTVTESQLLGDLAKYRQLTNGKQ